jgi:hypothetical protein
LTEFTGIKIATAGATSGYPALLRMQDDQGTNCFTDITQSQTGINIRARANTAQGTIRFQGIGSGITPVNYGGFDASGNFEIGTTDVITSARALQNIASASISDGIFVGSTSGAAASLGEAGIVINTSTKPQILFDGGADSNLDIAVPTGEILQIGHWDVSANSATLQMSMETDGDFSFEGNNIQGISNVSTSTITASSHITMSGANTQLKFTGTTGPLGLEFGDSEANPNFRVYYRTTPNTLTFENNGETAKHTFDLDGDYTAVRDVSVGRNLTVTGDLTVNGTTTTLNTTTLDVEDKNITLNYSTGDSSSSADGAGITIQDAVSAGNDATILWDASNDEFDFSHGITLPDDKRLRFGAGNDLAIFHQTSNGNSIIKESGGGILSLQSNGSEISLYDTANSQFLAKFQTGGQAILYNNGVQRLNTNGSGIDVTGTADVDGLTNSGTTTFYDDVTFVGAGSDMTWDNSADKLNFDDNTKATFGNSNDLEIYHNGTDSVIDNITGDLYITNKADDKDIIIRTDNGSGGFTTYMQFDGSDTRILTTKDMRYSDSAKALFGFSNDLQIYHDGTHSYVDNNTGSLYISSTNSVQIEDNSGNDMITAAVGGAVTLFHNGSSKLATTSSGITVTGAIAETTLGTILDTSGNLTNINNVYASGYRIGSTTVISSSRNLQNINQATITEVIGTKYRVVDSRNVATTTDEGIRQVRFDFKTNSNGDNLSDGGTYHGQMLFQQWNDSTGGDTHALGFTDNGNIWHRRSDIGGTWDTWYKIVETGRSMNVSLGTITGSGKLEINQAGNGTSNQPSAVAELSGQNQGGVLKALSLVNSVTAASGNGTQIAFHNANGYSPTGTLTVTQAGDTTTDSKMEFQIYRGGLQTAMRIDHDGHVDLLDGNLKINGTTVIDTSRNLQNIGTINSGNITATQLTVDDITINGSTISDSGNFTIDAAEIRLDSDSAGVIRLKDSGTEYGKISQNSNNLRIFSSISDGDILLQGNDGGTTITALQLDMSQSGLATFNSTLVCPNAYVQNLFISSSGVNSVNRIDNNGNDLYFTFGGTTNKALEIQNTNGNVKVTSGNLQMGTTTVIDGSRSLQNITGASFTSGGRDLDIILADSPSTGNVGVQLRAGASDYIGLAGGGGTGIGLVVDSSNKVGIGTQAPNARLEVNENTSFSTIDTFGQFVIKSSSGTLGDLLNFGVDSADSLAFIQAVERGTNVIPLVLQRYGGRVGIGTDSPDNVLHVKHASTNVVAKFESGDNQVWINLNDDGGGTYGALLGHDSDAGHLFAIADNSVTKRLVMDSSGNVAIGNDTPLAKLDVTGQINIRGTTGLYLYEANGTSFRAALHDDGTRTRLFADGNGSNAHMTFNGGNVGVGLTGTNHPSAKLHVSGSSNVEAKIESTNDNAILRISADSGGTGTGANEDPFLIFQSGGTDVARIYHDNSVNALIFDNNDTTERMRIDALGRLGIGTASPSEKLHVIGNILTSGGVKVGDSSADALHFFGILKQGSGSGTTVMDSSRNLTNIGTISNTGRHLIQGGNLQMNNGDNSHRYYYVQTNSGGGDFLLGQIENNSSTDGAIEGTVCFAYDYGTTSESPKIHFSFAQRSGTARGNWWYEHDDDAAGSNNVKVVLIDDGSGNMYVWLRVSDYARISVSAITRHGSNWTNSGTLSSGTITTGTTLFDTSNDPTSEHHIGKLYAHDDVILPDSKIVKLGTGLDLQIYHNGTNSFINNDTGDLFIKNFANDEDIVFQCDDGSGGVATYFQLDGSQAQSRFLKDAQFDDSVQLKIGSSGDMSIQHNGTDSKITNNTGDLEFRQNVDDGDIILKSDDGSGGTTQYIRCDGGLGQVQLYHYGTKMFNTTSAGVKVEGEVNLTGQLEINGTDVIDSSRNLTNINSLSVAGYIYHTGDTDTNIQFATDQIKLNTGGSLRFQAANTGATVLGVPLNISAPNSAEMKFLQTTGSSTASKGSIQWVDSGGNSCGTINLKADGADDNSGVMEFYVTANTDELGDDPFGINKMMTITENGVTVHGSLSKSSGSFRIDHPLKPETHDLVHSFVESPQADNLYRGVIDLYNGRATIDLDEWFGMTSGTFLALNRDIQAFANNADTWDNVRAKVMGSQLVIECQNPQSNARVSWLVIGERQDKEMHESSLTDNHGKVIVEPLKVG